ncbi:hypothetical protein MUU53_02500 [Rhizobium lemnae]|uniref:CN hydrolase domain-containing protein n=1 Tax=Rhizobium lemnae TaxID=1214924 RepID=A0ABV8E581_9HYPH|nr:hypothetical protein [Rhizobium lemnae]MCJ8506778.1 hypothetical protein [Rhizobium lemnae]
MDTEFPDLSTLKECFRAIPDMDPTRRLKLAAYYLWHAFSRAPSPFLQSYADVSETVYLKEAKPLISEPDSIIAKFDLENDTALAKTLGVYLRAIDEVIAAENYGSFPVDPNVDWVIDGAPRAAFFIPESPRAWRSDKNPDDDHRVFNQRGLLKNRILPGVIDGADVKFYFLQSSQAPTTKIKFGAVLYPKIKFEYDPPETDDFIITKAACRKKDTIAADAIRRSHQEQCSITVFPEMTVDGDALAEIKNNLKLKPWLEEGPLGVVPDIVIAGSWHQQRDGAMYNVATVLDGNGDLKFEYRKRLKYRDAKSGRAERIEYGTELPVIILEHGLFGVGICLDYCDGSYPTPYGKLDVDCVLVPSCGNDQTMRSHIDKAWNLNLDRKSRAFVVQQGDSGQPRRPFLGYVLPPMAVKSSTQVASLTVRETWSTYDV